MKKFWAIVIALFMLGTLMAGCGVKEKIEEKIGEKIAEDIAGSDVDIKKDGSVTIKGEDGEVKLGGSEWPTDELTKSIPKFENGKVSDTMVSEGGCMIFVAEVEKKDFTDYLEKVKSSGFDKNTFTSESDGDQLYAAQKDKLTVALTYSEDDKTMSITIGKESE